MKLMHENSDHYLVVPMTLTNGLATLGTKANAVAMIATIAINIILFIEFILSVYNQWR